MDHLKNKSTKKFLNKIFHPAGNKKNSSSVSPHENDSFATSFVALDLSNQLQRRYSFSNVHENGRQKLLAAKRKEYQEKMEAFDDLIQRRRGVTLTYALNSDALSR
ncbi:14495_t:CDS:2 [Racocetra persica]|uniref:14495_t:CDS:1 n=1 Tax=Racocetra persica TaxID=160502 RepID=A0ACA9MFX3_9GLOM|nr:14495_t:CDS:2 [Racocetra persica]